MLFYESAKCLHGRMNEFKGKYYGSIFLHYNPVDKDIWNYKHDVSYFQLIQFNFLNFFHLFCSCWYDILFHFPMFFWYSLIILIDFVLLDSFIIFVGCDCRCPPTLVWRYHRDPWVKMGWSGKYIRSMKNKPHYFLHQIFDFPLYIVTLFFYLVILTLWSIFILCLFFEFLYLFLIIITFSFFHSSGSHDWQ